MFIAWICMVTSQPIVFCCVACRGIKPNCLVLYCIESDRFFLSCRPIVSNYLCVGLLYWQNLSVLSLIVLYSIVLSPIILFPIVLYSIVLYPTVSNKTKIQHTAYNCILRYSSVLYKITLYPIVLYRTVFYPNVLFRIVSYPIV